MHILLRKFQERYKITKTSSLLFIVSFSIAIFSLLLMNTMANISSFWSVDKEDGPPLPDMFFEYSSRKPFAKIVDILMNTLIGMTIFLIFIKREAIQIFFRFFVCLSISYFLRMSTVGLTNLPSPNVDCLKIVNNMLTTFTFNRCGDAMFSGHTLIVMICALTWSSYDLLPYLSNMVWVFSFIIFMGILFARNHYTIDVLLAIYITGSVWVIYGWIWDRYLCKEEIFSHLIIENN